MYLRRPDGNAWSAGHAKLNSGHHLSQRCGYLFVVMHAAIGEKPSVWARAERHFRLSGPAWRGGTSEAPNLPAGLGFVSVNGREYVLVAAAGGNPSRSTRDFEELRRLRSAGKGRMNRAATARERYRTSTASLLPPLSPHFRLILR